MEVGLLQVNCYLLWDVDTKKAAVIDPGDDADIIIKNINELDLDVEWVLLTHGHFDHTFRVGEIASRYEVKIAMQALDLPALTQRLGFEESFYDMSQRLPFSVTNLINEGDEIYLGESVIRVLHTPGHTQGGVCYVTDIGVFCGDTIFAGSVGRSDFPGGSHEQVLDSIRTKILPLDDSTPLYPGHGPSTSVGVERRSNPFL
jgi:hydroxyacylglutathione hydrolase